MGAAVNSFVGNGLVIWEGCNQVKTNTTFLRDQTPNRRFGVRRFPAIMLPLNRSFEDVIRNALQSIHR